MGASREDVQAALEGEQPRNRNGIRLRPLSMQIKTARRHSKTFIEDCQKSKSGSQSLQNLKSLKPAKSEQRPSVLDLSCNNIEKMENLKNLESIKELKLYGNKILVVENLDKLRELQYLKLQHNQLKSFGSGLNCPSLHTLRVDYNNLTEIKSSQLAGCPNLRSLNVSSNNLKILSFVKVLPDLEELAASGNQLSNLSDISTCLCLRELDISDNRLSDISGISDLASLQTLNLSGNSLKDIKNAGKHPKLTDLQIQGNKLTETEDICVQFPNLEVLNISFNLLDSWTEVINLQNLASLTELTVKCNSFVHQYKFYHADVVKEIPSLQWLDGINVKENKKTLNNSNIRQASAYAGAVGNDLNKELESLDLSPEIINDITERLHCDNTYQKLSRSTPLDNRIGRHSSHRL
ncbi:protein phosphatase 1 regulatory subunit 7-like [Octopus vulgaris]|uniref:Protein phosphatase 1 regulatory subunit 7-like n=1 Tax=Octopus vulgaris TaxID=6645 RepID=A0AA36AYD9_OCTVU|nr:protein phosphatase 1 regulatory subunit 7-like [Octopus vulgaris]